MAEIIAGILTLGLIGFAIAAILAKARLRFTSDAGSVIDEINRLLPQTQCAQCGYPGCKPYAEAIAQGEAINKCPPGGDTTVTNLSALLGREPIPLDPSCGEPDKHLVAEIREDECIGCTLCIQACPVDAIVGAQQLMHTVIAAECTGCELCLPPCPVDCIDLIPIEKETLHLVPAPEPVLPCIRCGNCEDACPRALAPQELYWYRDATQKLDALNLDACIECRRCDRVCPSNIPLTDIFKTAKVEKEYHQAQERLARHAEARFEQHNARIEQTKQKVRARPDRSEKASLLETIKQRQS